MSDVLRCEEDVRFVDNGGIVEHDCLNCLFITVSCDLLDNLISTYYPKYDVILELMLTVIY